MAKKFSSELDSRGTVKVTDKLMIQNIDTGAVEYTTVAELLTALSICGVVNGSSIAPAASGNAIGHLFLGKDMSMGLAMGGYSTGGASGYSWIQSTILDAAQYNTTLILNPNGGNVSIGTIEKTSALQVAGVPEYNDNTNAAASGLTAGAFYRTGDTIKVVHA